MINAKITGVGGFVPEDIMTNQDFEKIMDTSDEWITSRTGIKERRILKGKGLGTSYMGLKAVQDLLIKSGTKATEIDLLIVGTVTPDMFFPNSANLICDELGIHGVPSFDLSAACSGFLYSLETGSNFISPVWEDLTFAGFATGDWERFCG